MAGGNTLFQMRRDTAANWTSNNPTLSAGEPGYETDTGKFKIGDGSTAWTSLGYFPTGPFAFSGDISPSQITSNQNDYNPTGLSTASTLRLSSDASRDITGLQGGADGRILFVHNVGAQNIVLKDESASSSAANRFALTADVTLSADSVAVLQYDSTSSRWRAVSGGGGSGGFTAASTTEQLTGTDTTKGSTPDSVAALWEQGSDVASAGTISLGEGGYFFVTGTTTITDIDFATDKAGRTAWVKFAGILTLTHNASTLILPGAANITTAAGDTACFISEGSDVIRCVSYNRAASLPPLETSGSWTPTMNFGGGSTGLTYTKQNGYYVRAGKLVTIWFDLQLNAKGSSTGNVYIGGLPYNVSTTLNQVSSPMWTTNSASLNALAWFGTASGAGAATMFGLRADVIGLTALTNTAVANSDEFVATLSYITDDA